MSIQDRAMLVDLSVSTWSNALTDATLGDELCQSRKAHNGSATVRRYLVDERHLRPVYAAGLSLRRCVYHWTLPWGNNGERALSNLAFERFMADYRTKKSAFDSSVTAFIDHYPNYVKEAEVIRGGFYREEDYPNPAEIGHKFAADIAIKPIPQADDFRVEVVDVDAIRANIEQTNQKRLQDAHQALQGRIYAALKHLADRLRDPDGERYKKLFSSVLDLADLVPGLNLTQDPDIDRIAAEIKAEIGSLSVDTISGKVDKNEGLAETRESVAARVDNILAKFGRIG